MPESSTAIALDPGVIREDLRVATLKRPWASPQRMVILMETELKGRRFVAFVEEDALFTQNECLLRGQMPEHPAEITWMEKIGDTGFVVPEFDDAAALWEMTLVEVVDVLAS